MRFSLKRLPRVIDGIAVGDRVAFLRIEPRMYRAGRSSGGPDQRAAGVARAQGSSADLSPKALGSSAP